MSGPLSDDVLIANLEFLPALKIIRSFIDDIEKAQTKTEQKHHIALLREALEEVEIRFDLVSRLLRARTTKKARKTQSQEANKTKNQPRQKIVRAIEREWDSIPQHQRPLKKIWVSENRERILRECECAVSFLDDDDFVRWLSPSQRPKT